MVIFSKCIEFAITNTEEHDKTTSYASTSCYIFSVEINYLAVTRGLHGVKVEFEGTQNI